MMAKQHSTGRVRRRRPRALLRYDDFGFPTTTSVGTPSGLEPVFGGMRYLNITGGGGSTYSNRPAGLYLGMFRLYDGANGVWLSNDPLEYFDGPNMSAYVSQNPIGMIDPLGLGKRDSSGGADESTPAISHVEPRGVSLAQPQLPIPHGVSTSLAIDNGKHKEVDMYELLSGLNSDIDNAVAAGRFEQLRQQYPDTYDLIIHHNWNKIIEARTGHFLIFRLTDHLEIGYAQSEALADGYTIQLNPKAIENQYQKGVPEFWRTNDPLRYSRSQIFHELMHLIVPAQGEITVYALLKMLYPKFDFSLALGTIRDTPASQLPHTAPLLPITGLPGAYTDIDNKMIWDFNSQNFFSPAKTNLGLIEGEKVIIK